MDISYSSLSNFRSCHKRYKFKSLDRYEPRHETPELGVGKAVHEAFEQYFQGTPKDRCLEFIKNRFDSALADASAWEYEDLLVGKYTAVGMWEFYPHHKLRFDEVHPEQGFKVKVRDNIFLVGFLDGLVREKGKLWIREVKTTGLGIHEYVKRAEVSYQSTGYIWAMQTITKEPVIGVIYDIIRKPLLRKRTSENAQQFAERNYDYYRDHKNHKDLFCTHHSYRSNEQIEAFVEDLNANIDEFMSTNSNGKYYRNPDNCFSFGRECPYKKICWQKNHDPGMIQAFYKVYEHKDLTGKNILTEENYNG